MSDGSPFVLCVEDDVDTQEMMRVMVGGWGYGFIAVGTCAEALRLIREKDLKAVLLDNSLPDCSGTDLCRQVREFDLHLPIIFLSGSTQPEERRLAEISGATAFLSKPVAFDALFKLLNTHAPF